MARKTATKHKQKTKTSKKQNKKQEAYPKTNIKIKN